jgi:hypothetical protein
MMGDGPSTGSQARRSRPVPAVRDLAAELEAEGDEKAVDKAVKRLAKHGRAKIEKKRKAK